MSGATWGWCVALLWLRLAAAGDGGERLRCPPGVAERCKPPLAGTLEKIFQVNGETVKYSYKEGSYFGVWCPAGVALDEPALPRFEPELLVGKARVVCTLGPGAVADALRALRVRVTERLAVEGGDVTRAALAGLGGLAHLELAELRLERGALRALPGLPSLRLQDVPLEPRDLDALPPALTNLTLARTGLAALGGDALARLPRLEGLIVRAGDTPLDLDVAAAAALRALGASGPRHVAPALPASLVDLSLHKWTVRLPPAWTACRSLRSLRVRESALEELPPGWLRPCAALRWLEVTGSHALARVAEDALEGAAALEELTLSGGALVTLPSGLLLAARGLRALDVSGNPGLAALPSFARSPALARLDATGCALADASLEGVSGLTALEVLRLGDNTALDACPADRAVQTSGLSRLQNLSRLRELRLGGTRTAAVCADWRNSMGGLETLDLSGTNFTVLTLQDLRFSGERAVTLDLRGAALRELAFGETDVQAAAEHVGPAVLVRLSGELVCDCHTYWGARALRDAPLLRLEGARCAGGGAWLVDDMTCPKAECAPRCACAERPDKLLRVTCANATAVPRVRREPGVRVELLLAGNAVQRLRAQDVADDVAVLDLRNNSVRGVDAGAVAALPRGGLLLGGNPLRCDCDAAPALAALAAGAALADLRRVRCGRDSPLGAGRALAAFAAEFPAACVRSAAPAAGLAALGALLAAALVAAAALLSPALRRCAKRLLAGPGGGAGAGSEPDEERRYDVFVSFAHGDEAVARALVAGLEEGPVPLRVCVHYRDWAPGGWIPAQIAASVRASRRTLAVLSARFLASAWARAEFREAHALALREARPRLLVVLLAEPASLPLDDELRAYLAANTYLLWGDPYFWSKLRRAVPPPPRAAPRPPVLDTAASESTTSVRSDDSGVGSAPNTPTADAETGSVLSVRSDDPGTRSTPSPSPDDSEAAADSGTGSTSPGDPGTKPTMTTTLPDDSGFTLTPHDSGTRPSAPDDLGVRSTPPNDSGTRPTPTTPPEHPSERPTPS